MDKMIKILEKEEDALKTVALWQGKLREAVKERDWKKFSESANNIDSLMQEFQSLEEGREDASFETQDKERINSAIMRVRQKLLRIKIENSAIGQVIKTTRLFVARVLDTALPQRKNKIYTRKGYNVSSPQSVLVDRLF